MKSFNFLAVAAVLFGCTVFAHTAQAQTAKGPARNAVFIIPGAKINIYWTSTWWDAWENPYAWLLGKDRLGYHPASSKRNIRCVKK
ncbi:MAG: hypothetical protein LBR36_03615 [Bacteroidales bacterium]|jgi:hypothetical protein|nr:hypothetical protein [Bacteroidales bacterium]